MKFSRVQQFKRATCQWSARTLANPREMCGCSCKKMGSSLPIQNPSRGKSKRKCNLSCTHCLLITWLFLPTCVRVIRSTHHFQFRHNFSTDLNKWWASKRSSVWPPSSSTWVAGTTHTQLLLAVLVIAGNYLSSRLSADCLDLELLLDLQQCHAPRQSPIPLNVIAGNQKLNMQD